MKYSVKKINIGFEVLFENGYKVKISNTELTEHDVKILVESNMGMYINESNFLLYENIRKQRNVEFNLYDKYQLVLVWESLSEEQQSEYATWRSSWLDATVTLETPERLSWFE